MKSLVVLEPMSAIGRSYLQSKNADLIHLGEYPVIECSRVEPNGPYLHCFREGSDARPGEMRLDQGPKCSEILVPHHAVAFVRQYTEGESRPVGFAPVAKHDSQQ